MDSGILWLKRLAGDQSNASFFGLYRQHSRTYSRFHLKDSYSKEDWLIIESTDPGASHYGRRKNIPVFWKNIDKYMKMLYIYRLAT